jgi:ectoine hydroxylase-related dioxygenase (phytanoyl-CoA dioxygenase family)
MKEKPMNASLQNQFDTQDYFFDLNGYLILENAIDPDHLARLNTVLDEFPQIEFGHWHGNVQRLDNNGMAGMELQNIVEGGEPFEELIDHPSWIERVHRYCGEKGCFYEGLFIDECFATIRRNGGYFPLHSGGHDAPVRIQYRYFNGQFRCGQVNILMALNDINPGDGGTCVVPGSHKSNFPHPLFSKPFRERVEAENEHVEGGIEVTLKAGNALLIVDSLAHGATSRVNPGERRQILQPIQPRTTNVFSGIDTYKQ